jgi:glycerophosphoryl diester phosphodiesterase
MAMIGKDGEETIAFELLAHRGYAARYPENTRLAISAAVDAGARCVEFDIQLSHDRVPHLMHDEDFRRTGNSTKRIFDLDAEQVAGLGVGEPGRLGDAFTDVRAPRLAEIVEDLRGWPEVTAFVEIKRQSLAHFGIEVVLDAVLEVLEPVLQQCVIISFDTAVLEETRRRVDRPVGWAVRTWNNSSRKIAEALQPEYLFCNVNKLPAVHEPLWEGSWTWVVYEITDWGEACQLAARGVGMIETMAYAEMHAESGMTR